MREDGYRGNCHEAERAGGAGGTGREFAGLCQWAGQEMVGVLKCCKGWIFGGSRRRGSEVGEVEEGGRWRWSVDSR